MADKKNTKEVRFRISVFRSNAKISAQIIDDQKGVTLIAISSKSEKGKKPQELALIAGKELAQKAIEKGIKKVYFDRNKFRYHGRVKSLAEGLRQGGLEF